jgi:hypothetical protein
MSCKLLGVSSASQIVAPVPLKLNKLVKSPTFRFTGITSVSPAISRETTALART